MNDKKLRLFFAVNLPEKVKEELAERLMPLIPKEKWRKVLAQNLHVTMHFLGYLPREAVEGLREQVKVLEEFEEFQAELNCAGHFKGRVLWLGFGKGLEEFKLLNSKLQQAIGTYDERFHPHITLARNKGASRQEAQLLVEKLREKLEPVKITVKSIELMQSQLQKAGPKYSVVFRAEFSTQAHE